MNRIYLNQPLVQAANELQSLHQSTGIVRILFTFYSEFKITLKKLGAFPNSFPLPKARSASLLFFILVTGKKLWLLVDNIFNCFEESNTAGHGKVLTRAMSLLLTTVHQSLAWSWI